MTIAAYFCYKPVQVHPWFMLAILYGLFMSNIAATPFQLQLVDMFVYPHCMKVIMSPQQKSDRSSIFIKVNQDNMKRKGKTKASMHHTSRHNAIKKIKRTTKGNTINHTTTNTKYKILGIAVCQFSKSYIHSIIHTLNPLLLG